MAENKGTSSTPQRSAPAGYENLDKVTIELGDSRNRQFLFKVTGDVLRGRWSKANLRCDGEINEDTGKLPDVIPGLCIELDARRMTAKIFDPLALPKNAELLAVVQKKLKIALNHVEGPERERNFQLRNETQVKTWLWAMRQLVDGAPIDYDQDNQPVGGGPQARVVSGTLPTAEEIERLPGKTQIGQQDSASTRKPKYREEELAALAGA